MVSFFRYLLAPARWRVGRHWTLESAREELDRSLRQSVREHMVSDVPLGVWLSGGIDSSTILHYAANESSSPLKTFSISFRGRSFDETRYISGLPSDTGTDHEELDLNPERICGAPSRNSPIIPMSPVADAGALPVWFLSKLSKTRTTVASAERAPTNCSPAILPIRRTGLLRFSGCCRERVAATCP